MLEAELVAGGPAQTPPLYFHISDHLDDVIAIDRIEQGARMWLMLLRFPGGSDFRSGPEVSGESRPLPFLLPSYSG